MRVFSSSPLGMILFILGGAFTLWIAVECARRFLYVDAVPLRRRRRASKRELSHAWAEVRRLDNSEAWTHYAEVLSSRGRLSEALEAAETACARDAESPRALYQLGLAQMACGKHRESAASLSRLVERDPGHDSGEARFALALALEGSGDEVGARRTLESLARTTSLPKVLFRLASLQAEAGDHEGARQVLERIIEESAYVPSYHRREVRPWVRKARKALAALPA